MRRRKHRGRAGAAHSRRRAKCLILLFLTEVGSPHTRVGRCAYRIEVVGLFREICRGRRR